jgi:hypothetical protein
VGALLVTASDYIDIRGPQILYTDRSYTVSALVKLNAAGQSNQIILIQGGNGQHAFVLKYRAPDSRWVFGLPAASANSSTYLEMHLGTSSSSKFDGVLDRVEVFQRALTAAEVRDRL